MEDRLNVMFVADIEGIFEPLAGPTIDGKCEVFVAIGCLNAIDILLTKPINFAYLVDLPGINSDDTYNQIRCHSPKTIITRLSVNDIITILCEITPNGVEIDDLEIGNLVN